jgi:hypothetical protein
MPKHISNSAIGSAPPVPGWLIFEKHRPAVYWPRMFFVIKNMASDPTIMAYEYKRRLAAALKVDFRSKPMEITFQLLGETNLINKHFVQIMKDRRAPMMYLTEEGRLLAWQLGYPTVETDRDRIRANIGNHMGKIANFAWLCRVCDMPVEVAPKIDTATPPDVLTGEEQRWVYVLRDKLLTPQYIRELYQNAPTGHPMGFVMESRNSCKEVLSTCKESSFSALFTDILSLVSTDDWMPPDRRIWLTET